MSDYISRENALLALDDFLDSEQEYGIIADCYSEADVDKAKKRIMCIPSAVGIDVEKIRHGKWETRTEWIGTFGFNKSKCSVCDAVFRDDRKGCEYCSKCGAKMDLKE